MSVIDNVRNKLESLTKQSWKYSFYGSVQAKRSALSAFDSTIQNSWKDGNGSRATSCSSSINQALTDATTQFANVNYYVTQAIKFAEKAESEREVNEQGE